MQQHISAPKLPMDTYVCGVHPVDKQVATGEPWTLVILSQQFHLLIIWDKMGILLNQMSWNCWLAIPESWTADYKADTLTITFSSGNTRIIIERENVEQPRKPAVVAKPKLYPKVTKEVKNMHVERILSGVKKNILNITMK